MRRRAIRFVLAFLLASVAGPAGAEPDPSDSASEEQRRIAATAEKSRRPFDEPAGAESYYRSQRRITDAGSPDPIERYAAARRHIRDMPRYSTRLAAELPPARDTGWPQAPLAGDPRAAEKAGELGTWTPLGPGNIGGRTRAVLIHPTQPSVMYAAGVSGGIWKTGNGGQSWRPIGDNLVNLAVTTMAMDPADPDVLYAGTGEGFFRETVRGTALPLRGAGIFKSVNGEGFFRLQATRTRDFHWVNDVLVSPTDSRRVYAATRTGVWRSLDAGASWRRILAPGVSGGCLELALRGDRATDVLFAACGSFDGGTVFRNEAAQAEGGWQAVLSPAGMGRTALALAPSNQDVIYAMAASIAGGQLDGGLHAVYRSDAGGDAGSWEVVQPGVDSHKLDTLLLTNPVIASLVECGFGGTNQFVNLGWYANVLAVDPVDPDVVYAGGVDLFRSDDGGRSWGLISYWFDAGSAHADQHAIVFDPRYDGVTNQRVFVGGDGGVARSDNPRGRRGTGAQGSCDPRNTAVRWTRLNRGYGVTQFYHGTPYPDGRSFFGGTQDNGTVRGTRAAGGDGWERIHGGDGGYVAVDPTRTHILYAESQEMAIVKSVDGGNSFEDAVNGIGEGDGDVLFITPLVLDPNDPDRLWTGGRRMWRTDDGAGLWRQASPQLAAGGRVAAIAVAPGRPRRVYAGLDNGYVHRSDDALAGGAGSAWPASRPRTGFVTWIAVDPNDPDIVYATYADFGGQHVWRSRDGAVTWTAIDGTGGGRLPDIPAHSLVVDPRDSDRLFLGTDLGVYVSRDGGASWSVENSGFPNAVTETLVYNAGSDELFAFTHGRGAWKVRATPAASGTVQLSATTIVGDENEGVIEISASRVGGADGRVTVSYSTVEGSAAAGSDYLSTQGMLVWSNGDAAPKTFSVQVVDDGEIEGVETFSVALTGATGGATLGDPATAVIELRDDDVEPFICAADEATLCLGTGGRFEVRLEWTDFDGDSGPGRVVEGGAGADSGLMWFFSADNWELLAKIVDACAFNDRYWVLFAATTNVGYELTFTDAAAGKVRRFRNDLGTAAPSTIDVDAFATCP